MNELNLQYFVLICDRKKKKRFLDLVASYGALSIKTHYGRGSAKGNVLSRAFGLEAELHKAVISCILTHEQATALTAELCNTYEFHRANTGFAFSIPIEGLSF